MLSREQVQALADGTRVMVKWLDVECLHIVSVREGVRYVGPVNMTTYQPWPEVRLAE